MQWIRHYHPITINKIFDSIMRLPLMNRSVKKFGIIISQAKPLDTSLLSKGTLLHLKPMIKS